MPRPSCTELRSALSALVVAASACSNYDSDPARVADAGSDQAAPHDGGVPSTDAGGTDGATSDGGPACAAETCVDRLGCVFDDFSAGCSKWSFYGDLATTTHECVAGKLRIAAQNTDDILAVATHPTPTQPYRVRVAARVTIADWDGGQLLAVTVGGSRVAELRADRLGPGTARVSLCDNSGCATAAPPFAMGTEHLLALDLSSGGVTAFFDCAELATMLPLAPLQTESTLTVAFGRIDAQPIDGTIDDVLVWFKP